MYCRNCGKEIQADAKFCSFCGESNEVAPKARKQIQVENMLKFDKEIIFHYLSMLTSLIIIGLTFSKWITVESWIVSSNFSTWGLIKVIGNLSKYTDAKMVSGFATLMVFLMVTIIFLSGYYIFKSYHGGKYPENNDHIIYGYPSMLAIAIICSVFIILAMIIFSSSDFDAISVYFNEKIYYIIALACLNRFVLLPKLNRIIFDRKKQNEVESDSAELKEKVS